jgi:hypothetical protein
MAAQQNGPHVGGGGRHRPRHGVRPQLDELLFSSVEGVSVELIEVTDTVLHRLAK